MSASIEYSQEEIRFAIYLYERALHLSGEEWQDWEELEEHVQVIWCGIARRISAMADRMVGATVPPLQANKQQVFLEMACRNEQ